MLSAYNVSSLSPDLGGSGNTKRCVPTNKRIYDDIFQLDTERRFVRLFILTTDNWQLTTWLETETWFSVLEMDEVLQPNNKLSNDVALWHMYLTYSKRNLWHWKHIQPHITPHFSYLVSPFVNWDENKHGLPRILDADDADDGMRWHSYVISRISEAGWSQIGAGYELIASKKKPLTVRISKHCVIASIHVRTDGKTRVKSAAH